MSKHPENDSANPWDDTDPVFDAIKQALANGDFATLEEAEQAVAAVAAQHNQGLTPLFQGLSPEQMHGLIYTPFEAPGLVEFVPTLDQPSLAKAMVLLQSLAQAIGDKGLKLTAKGNLPRSVVASAKEAIASAGFAREGIGPMRNEEDFNELHTIKLVAELGRLTRKQHGRLLLTRTTQKHLDKGDWSALFGQLLRNYCQKFNWAYRDGSPELSIIQHAFAFSLYLFHRYGDRWRPIAFYQERFLAAFPMMAAEVPSSYTGLRTPEAVAQGTWALRTVNRFAHFFGLLEYPSATGTPGSLMQRSADDLIRKSPLLDQCVRWQIP